jgi:hypothetical protein
MALFSVNVTGRQNRGNSISASFNQRCEHDSQDSQVLRHPGNPFFVLPTDSNHIATKLQRESFPAQWSSFVRTNSLTNPGDDTLVWLPVLV